MHIAEHVLPKSLESSWLVTLHTPFLQVVVSVSIRASVMPLILLISSQDHWLITHLAKLIPVNDA